MKVNNISNFNFTSNSREHKRFMTPNAKESAQKLLWEMNHQTTYKLNPEKTGWESNILSRISIEDIVYFNDNRYLVQPVENVKEISGDCTIKMGKTRLDINSKTGEIINYKKSWFKTWSTIQSQTEQCLHALVKYFENPEVVQRSSVPIAGFTQKGLKLLNEAQMRINLR